MFEFAHPAQRPLQHPLDSFREQQRAFSLCERLDITAHGGISRRIMGKSVSHCLDDVAAYRF